MLLYKRQIKSESTLNLFPVGVTVSYDPQKGNLYEGDELDKMQKKMKKLGLKNGNNVFNYVLMYQCNTVAELDEGLYRWIANLISHWHICDRCHHVMPEKSRNRHICIRAFNEDYGLTIRPHRLHNGM
jgi:hypothetical protein